MELHRWPWLTPTKQTPSAGSQMTPSSTPWIWSTSPSFSFSTPAYWELWPPVSLRWNECSAGPRETHRGSLSPAREVSLCLALPASWGPPGVWPSWALATSTTQSSTCSVSSTPYKVSLFSCGFVCRPRSRGKKKCRKDWVHLMWGQWILNLSSPLCWLQSVWWSLYVF